MSQASIKDHLQKPRIIALAKSLFDADSPKSCLSRLGKDYLQQACKMIDSTPPATPGAHHSIAFTSVKGCMSTFVASSQDLFGADIAPAGASPSYSQVAKDAAKNMNDWSIVSRHPKPKATIPGTKLNKVLAMVPDDFHVPYPSLGINGPKFTEHICDALRAHPGTLALLNNNPFLNAVWSNNHKRIEVSFQFTLDQQLKLAMHAVLTAFFGAPISDMQFIDRPTISLLKWLAVPHLMANTS